MAIDDNGSLLGEQRTPLEPPVRQGTSIEQDPHLWWRACNVVLQSLCANIDCAAVRAIAVDATSGTLLLTDQDGQPLSQGLMYNDARAKDQLARIRNVAPPDSIVHAVTAGLPKLLWLMQQTNGLPVAHVMHQADWINYQLCGRSDISDSNNCLKTGYDAAAGRWPDWMHELGIPADWLPRVVSPGHSLGPIDPSRASELGLPASTLIVSGTTDSTAAIIATGAHQVGDAVTSLGSTLVCKVICDQPVFASDYGVYSQPYGEHWLVGGGSNSGGAVLRHYFTDAQMQKLSKKLDPSQPTGLDYYPLPATGERFPVNDPALAPRMTPRPENDTLFFQGLLEGIAQIEYNGYRRLQSLGAPYPRSVRSVGGGAVNTAWTRIRARLLETSMLEVEHSEAAYGSALLARQGFKNQQDTRT